MPFSFKPTTTEEVTPSVAAPVAAPTLSSPTSSAYAARPTESGRGILDTVALGIFLLMIGVVAVLFGYKYYLQSTVAGQKATIDSYESRLSGIPLEEIHALSNRLKVINQLVKDHPSVNAAFKVLESGVENAVTFTNFNLSYDNGSKAYSLSLAANAPDYRSVVQQMDTLKRKPYASYFPNIKIEELRPDSSGRVAFNMKMGANIKGVLPEGILLDTESSQVSVATTTVVTQTASPATATGTAPVGTGTSTGAGSTASSSKPSSI